MFVDFGVFIGHCSKEGKLKCPTCARSVVFNSSPWMLATDALFSHNPETFWVN